MCMPSAVLAVWAPHNHGEVYALCKCPADWLACCQRPLTCLMWTYLASERPMCKVLLDTLPL